MLADIAVPGRQQAGEQAEPQEETGTREETAALTGETDAPPAETAEQDPFAAEVQRQMLGETETVSTGETETGLIPISEQMQERLSTGKNNIVAKTFNDIISFVKNAQNKKGGSERLYMGTLPESASALVKSSTGVDVTGYTAILPSSSVQHIFNRHGNAKIEAARGQQAVTAEDVALIPQVLSAPDSVTLSEKADAMGRTVLLFSKQIGGTYITAQAVTDGRQMLTTNTLWIQKKKDLPDTTSDADVSADPAHNVQNVPPSGPSASTLPQSGEDVNYAEALQRAGASAEAAEMAAYFLEQAAQGKTLTADQSAILAAVPGGEALLDRLQTAQETAQTAGTAKDAKEYSQRAKAPQLPPAYSLASLKRAPRFSRSGCGLLFCTPTCTAGQYNRPIKGLFPVFAVSSVYDHLPLTSLRYCICVMKPQCHSGNLLTPAKSYPWPVQPSRSGVFWGIYSVS